MSVPVMSVLLGMLTEELRGQVVELPSNKKTQFRPNWSDREITVLPDFPLQLIAMPWEIKPAAPAPVPEMAFEYALFAEHGLLLSSGLTQKAPRMYKVVPSLPFVSAKKVAVEVLDVHVASPYVVSMVERWSAEQEFSI